LKKYLLGILIGIIFLAYSAILRHQHSEPVIAPTSLSENNSTSTPTPTVGYKNGTYTGSVENAFYGDVQVSVTISNDKISTVNFLQSPDENPNSIYVNQTAIPYLKQEAIKAQSSNVSIITGATFTSQAFMGSLSNALNQAKQGL
jgi:uncharacterized protein with FMN-binding domain